MCLQKRGRDMWYSWILNTCFTNLVLWDANKKHWHWSMDEGCRTEIIFRKNARIAISWKRHSWSPKRKMETTFRDLITPQKSGKTHLRNHFCFFSPTIAMYKTRVFKIIKPPDVCTTWGVILLIKTGPKTTESTDGLFRMTWFPFPGHVTTC